MSRGCPSRLLAVAAVFIVMPTYWYLRPPTRPIGEANGVYVNSCCGELTLKDGRMTAKSLNESYVVEYDKGGDYVLPKHYVGVDRASLVRSDTYKTPLKMRMGVNENRSTITVWGKDETFIFTKR